MGFEYKNVKKGVFIDGHEREDVVEYRNNIFLKRWDELAKRFIIFHEDGSWEIPPNLPAGRSPWYL
jgi:hypothetical protein